MLLLISFHAVFMHTIELSWKEEAFSRALGASFARFRRWTYEPYAGGTVVLFDWERNQVLWQILVDGASGFCFHQGLLYINQMRLNEIVVVNGQGQELRRLSHPLFNNLHSLVETQRGLLVTSTGIDSILEIDADGHCLSTWFASDHGYDTTRWGHKRMVDRTEDHRFRYYPTASHTTHVNAARPADDTECQLFATLFHQGTGILIDRATGSTTTLVQGLCHPHDIRRTGQGEWMIADTGNHRVAFFDQAWQCTHEIRGGFNWVQCAIPLCDGGVLVADTNHHRLVRCLSSRAPQEQETRRFPPDWRIFQVEEISEEERTFFGV